MKPSESGALTLRLFALIVQAYMKTTSQLPVRRKGRFKPSSSAAENKKSIFNLAPVHLQ